MPVPVPRPRSRQHHYDQQQRGGDDQKSTLVPTAATRGTTKQQHRRRRYHSELASPNADDGEEEETFAARSGSTSALEARGEHRPPSDYKQKKTSVADLVAGGRKKKSRSRYTNDRSGGHSTSGELSAGSFLEVNNSAPVDMTFRKVAPIAANRGHRKPTATTTPTPTPAVGVSRGRTGDNHQNRERRGGPLAHSSIGGSSGGIHTSSNSSGSIGTHDKMNSYHVINHKVSSNHRSNKENNTTNHTHNIHNYHTHNKNIHNNYTHNANMEHHESQHNSCESLPIYGNIKAKPRGDDSSSMTHLPRNDLRTMTLERAGSAKSGLRRSNTLQSHKVSEVPISISMRNI